MSLVNIAREVRGTKGQGAGGEGYGGAGGEGYGGARSEGMEGHGAGSRG